MKKYVDIAFGELYHEIYFIRDYEINIFNQSFVAELEVEVSDFNRITNFHRLTFIEFEKNLNQIIKKVEVAVINYCNKFYNASNKDNIFQKLTLTNIGINGRCDKNKRIIGFVIDDEYDPEMGIGIEMINEEVHAIGTQHLVC